MTSLPPSLYSLSRIIAVNLIDLHCAGFNDALLEIGLDSTSAFSIIEYIYNIVEHILHSFPTC